MSEKFAVLILTHGRPDDVVTIPTLRKHGYTGEVYLIVDHLDKSRDRYIENFGRDSVVVFDKYEAAAMTDTGDNFKEMRAVVYARNYAWTIAKGLGLDYFLVLDDDYKEFGYVFCDERTYVRHTRREKTLTKLDEVFSSVIEFYKSTPFLTLAFSQGGDFIGGPKSNFGEKIFVRRKAMNSFFCSTKRPFKFYGKINEDTTAYVRLGEQGKLLGTLNHISLEQATTQQNKGGLTDIYLNFGTYVKSFYSVMWSPSCVMCTLMGVSNPRIHHQISWKHATPMILRESIKKK